MKRITASDEASRLLNESPGRGFYYPLQMLDLGSKSVRAKD